MRRVFASAIVAGALLWALTAVAWGAAGFTNADCLGCHTTGSVARAVDFSVAPVDLANCNKCHWYALHPAHGSPTLSGCTGCHTAWPSSLPSVYYSSFTTTFGAFNGSRPPTDAATLHALHSRRTWPADMRSRSACVSCHAAAACTACHGSNVRHDPHPTQNGAPAPAAPVSELAPGTDGTLQSTAFTAAESCAADACHRGLAGERIVDDTSSAVTSSGTWVRLTDPAYSGGTALETTVSGSRLQVPFTGDEVSVWGATGYNVGSEKLSVDGVLLATKNSRQAGQRYPDGIWTIGGLGSGPHTLTIEAVVGVNQIVVFDRLVARDPVAAPTATPACAGCHPDKTVIHGYDATQHTSTTNMAGCIASGCHTTAGLMDEHVHWRPAFGCGDCHGTGAPDAVKAAIAAGNTGCEACHGANTHATAHIESAPDECVTCHLTKDPLALHANSHLGACAVCHANPTLGNLTSGKTNTDCLQCHDYSPFDPRHYHAAVHTSSQSQCAGCHDLELLPEHQSAAGFVPGTQCANCHAGSVWANLDRPWDKTCEACHPTKHAGADAKHQATLDHACTAICHTTSDVTLIHARATTTTAGGDTVRGCNVCHVSRAVRPASTVCVSCHGQLTADHGAVASLRGRVLDSVTGRPLAGVTVVLDGTKRFVVDRRGAFTFRDITPGWHTVKVSRASYRMTTVERHFLFGENVVMDLRMVPVRAVTRR